MNLTGLHHITAITGNAAQNVAFFTRTLGLRLIKKTVNFDDPGTYHLYYADESGTPGTVLTFFPFPNVRRGRVGPGQVSSYAFSVAPGALDFWDKRLADFQPVRGESRFGEPVLAFRDPDGYPLELIESEVAGKEKLFDHPEVPAPYALRRFHGVTLALAETEPTLVFLRDLLGATVLGKEGQRLRMLVGKSAEAARVDLVESPNAPRGMAGSGTIHHIAWRTPDDDTEAEARRELLEHRVAVSPITDRKYFHSIYFHEPEGILFEIATDPPGFAVDEAPERLGEALVLPDWLEPRREEIEARLPSLV